MRKRLKYDRLCWPAVGVMSVPCDPGSAWAPVYTVILPAAAGRVKEGERRGVSPPVLPSTGGLTPRRSPGNPLVRHATFNDDGQRRLLEVGGDLQLAAEVARLGLLHL